MDTRCYAVDTWKGDPHSGLYGPEVLEDLRSHHDPLYGSFSTLIQSTFDEAVSHFSDQTIDILHIDGYHTYQAIKHDFETWLPKVSPSGVVLMHDTNFRSFDFGVSTFWDETKNRYPHFDFLHCYGLGLLAVGESQTEAIRELTNSADEDVRRIREFFFELGKGLTLKLDNDRLEAERKKLEQELHAVKASLGYRLLHFYRIFRR